MAGATLAYGDMRSLNRGILSLSKDPGPKPHSSPIANMFATESPSPAHRKRGWAEG